MEYSIARLIPRWTDVRPKGPINSGRTGERRTIPSVRRPEWTDTIKLRFRPLPVIRSRRHSLEYGELLQADRWGWRFIVRSLCGVLGRILLYADKALSGDHQMRGDLDPVVVVQKENEDPLFNRHNMENFEPTKIKDAMEEIVEPGRSTFYR